MYKIPKKEEYYFDNGKFILRSKWQKAFKVGLMIGLVIGGVLTSNMTSSHIVTDFPTAVTIESKLIDYITDTNKNVSASEARDIVKSTMRWAREFDIDPILLLAIQKVESGFNKYSISNAGALGIMQVIPSWHLGKMSQAIKDVGNPEVFNINTNIYLGTWVLKNCMRQFDLTKNQLLCYNGSNAKPNGYDQKVLSSYREINNVVKG